VTGLTGGSDEREVLEGFLDWFRGVVEHKLDGLGRAELVEVRMPSGTTMLGIVKHLASAERLWFRTRFLGEPDEGWDSDESFRITESDTVESVLDRYRAECAFSRAAVAGAPSLDAVAAVEHPIYGDVTLRWILVHIIEETARHAGHLDILRELTDGRTGD
jgi:uncharacterized damage-inducible protein DinB